MPERGDTSPALGRRGAPARSTPDDPLARHSLSPGELKDLLAVEREGIAFMALRDGAGALSLFSLGRSGGTLTVGRRPDMDLSIAWDPEVSGLHAELESLAGEWTLVDDGLSRNGSFVNGERVKGRQRLRAEDRIRVGSTVIVYRAGGTGAAPEKTLAGEVPPPVRVTATQRSVLIALCRPCKDGRGHAPPASNQQIADELSLTPEAVKMHLRRLFAAFELTDAPQSEKRSRLAGYVLQSGVITERDLR